MTFMVREVGGFYIMVIWRRAGSVLLRSWGKRVGREILRRLELSKHRGIILNTIARLIKRQ